MFVDEEDRFITSRDFAAAVKNSDNYYVLVTRDSLHNRPFSVEEIYGIHQSGKYTQLDRTYNEFQLKDSPLENYDEVTDRFNNQLQR